MTIYQPAAQVKVPFFLQEAIFVVRSNADTASLAPALRLQVRNVDKDCPSARARVILLSRFSARHRRYLRRDGLCVTQRTQEIGIRMAIGAERRHIVQMILWRSAALVGGGLAIGLAGARAATRVLKDFLFEVTPVDPRLSPPYRCCWGWLHWLPVTFRPGARPPSIRWWHYDMSRWRKNPAALGRKP